MGRKGRRAAAITATGVKTPDYWESVVRQGCVYASGTDRASDRSIARLAGFAAHHTESSTNDTRVDPHPKPFDRSRCTQRVRRELRMGQDRRPH
jgi:hypothetical protein